VQGGFEAPAGEWTRVVLRHRMAPGADRLGVVLMNAGASALAFDDISLRGRQGPELLHNPGAEQSAQWSEGWLARRLATSPGFVPHPFDPASYSWEALQRYGLYVALTFAGFWANFGWLTIPLAPAWYVVLLAACLAAGVGLLRACRSGLGAGRRERRLWALLAAALLLIAAQTFVPMIGSAWQPQGRYFFPALLPIVALLAAGWRQLAPARTQPALALGLLIALLAFEQLCWWGYLLPHYAGSDTTLYMGIIYG
jgi:hypothetical protein